MIATRYTRTAITLHWVIAVVVAGSFVLGPWMTGLPTSPLKLRLYNWHKWAGATLLVLTLVRVVWRATHVPPPPVPMPEWQRRTASAVQAAMLLLFVVVALLGWAYSSAAGYPLVWFGVLPLPDFVPPDRALALAIQPWHARAAWLLAGLVGLHLAGVAKHHFIDQDALLQRMAPWRR